MRKLFIWLSGFFAGVFVGALIACPCKIVSLPLSAVLSIVFLWRGVK